LEAGGTFTAIAQKLGRAVSTISREVRRNGGQEHYRALEAEACAHKAALRPKECKLAKNGRLRRFVAEKLLREWSPEQISGALRRQFSEASMRVSHETIYRSLFVQARGVLKKELTKHLRTRRIMRRSKNATTKGQPRGQIVGAISISERPSAIEDRAVPGHWEGDLISGSNNTHIATLVERYSRFVMLVKVGGKDAETVAAALTKAILKLPQQLRGSLTWDRGSEMAQHQKITVATDVKVYFCDPSSPWQRGSNENTNGLLRQYFPKGTDLSGYTQRELNEIAKRLNQRPRKTLDFRTPADALEQALH
jgi:IS30 family transposase